MRPHLGGTIARIVQRERRTRASAPTPIALSSETSANLTGDYEPTTTALRQAEYETIPSCSRSGRIYTVRGHLGGCPGSITIDHSGHASATCICACASQHAAIQREDCGLHS